MEYIERDWAYSEDEDYAINIRPRAMEYRALEATPIHVILGDNATLVGWVLRRRSVSC